MTGGKLDHLPVIKGVESGQDGEVAETFPFMRTVTHYIISPAQETAALNHTQGP